MTKLDKWKRTDVLGKIIQARDSRIICLYGGSSSSKTISALQYLTTWALESTEPLVITIIGESLPVIKKSVLRDWQRLVMKSMYDPDRFNKQDNTYYFPRGTIMQFIPADDEMRFFSIRHDFVLIDEAYNVVKGIFDQVEIRTRIQILLTWNPVSPFWGQKLEDTRNDVTVIHATYKDNPYVEESIIKTLEMRAETDPNFYRVFVLGQYGTLEGLIFKEETNWHKVGYMPQDYKRRVLCLDFGFTYDPTVIVDLRFADGEFWADEITYQSGLTNPDIAEILERHGGKKDKTVGDSSEPKSIEEIKRLGISIVGAEKGPDSVKYGIRTMKGFKLNVTKSSTNIIRELRNYSYEKTKDGEYVDKPVDNWNHAIDAIRYGITHLRKKPNYGSYAVS